MIEIQEGAGGGSSLFSVVVGYGFSSIVLIVSIVALTYLGFVLRNHFKTRKMAKYGTDAGFLAVFFPLFIALFVASITVFNVVGDGIERQAHRQDMLASVMLEHEDVEIDFVTNFYDKKLKGYRVEVKNGDTKKTLVMAEEPQGYITLYAYQEKENKRGTKIQDM